MKKGSLFTRLGGLSIGLINTLLGAGGGMVAVPMLKKLGFDQNKAQANAVAIILPITIVSAGVYLFRGSVALSDAAIYIPTGLIGAFIGTMFLKKISPKILKMIFAIFMIYAGFRLLFK